MKFHELVNKVLNKIGSIKYNKINYIQTIIFNIRAFPVKIALKFPVYIYGKINIYSLGKVIIDAPIERGMIKIGSDPIKASVTKLSGYGTYIFHGPAKLLCGIVIENYGGTIEFGEGIRLGNNVKITCFSSIKFGNYVSVGMECFMTDWDYHFILNTKEHSVAKNFQPILIEEGTWISSHCKIMKGVFLPKNSIVVGGSMVNKSFKDEEESQIYAGIPAKPISKFKRRIHNVKEQNRLHKIFRTNSQLDQIKVDYKSEDDYCYSNFFG